MTEMCEPGRGTSGKTASIVMCGLNLGLGMKGRMAFPPHVVKILVRDTSVTLETGKKTNTIIRSSEYYREDLLPGSSEATKWTLTPT